MTETVERAAVGRCNPLEKRITPRRVIEAYEATGYEPTRGRFFEIGTLGQERACPLLAVAKNEAVELHDEYDPSRMKGMYLHYIRPVLDLDLDYLVGFLNGFDGTMGGYVPSEKRFSTGRNDGRRAHDFLARYMEV